MIKYIDMGLDDVLVMVSTDVLWADFAAEVSRYGLRGAEGLQGLPGNVGAAVTENYSAGGSSVGNIVSGVVCIDHKDGSRCRFTSAQCAFAPGDSVFRHTAGRFEPVSVLMRLSRPPHSSGLPS